MKKILDVVLIVTVVLVAGYLYQKYRVAPGIKFEKLELTDLTGKPVNLRDFHNKKVFLNFFQTWCGPCIAEFPLLDKAAEELMPDNFVFISISDEPLPLLNRVNSRINTEHVIILHSVKKLKELGVNTYPTSYVLNDRGSVVFEKVGDQNWAEAQTIQLLKQKAD